MKALLALEDGFTLEGESFTGPIELTGGEVVSNTVMIGYQEVLTDPAYAGQMVCMAYPTIGSYGICPDDMESDRIHMSALIMKECCRHPSNWRSTESLTDFLVRNGVPGIEGIDTRALALHVRRNGAMRACISTSILDPEELVKKAKELPAIETRDLVSDAAPAGIRRWDAEAGRPAPAELAADGSYAWPAGMMKIALVDYGTRRGVIRRIAAMGAEVVIVPPSFTCDQMKALAPDGVFLGSGPGTATALPSAAAEAAKMAECFPIAGIGLGCQMLGLAMGAGIAKLKVGHHGANYPVQNKASGRVEITSQNHGFQVLPCDAMASVLISMDDGSIAGFRHVTKPMLAAQYYPGQAFYAEFKTMIAARA
ncbi:MAG: glutamine-hydrolyzing carbamoyl-phosphate synthase small subunit [Mailhella sp.]|nr:glutamine-hydrolyzing carbamoyl-phosphate synthase small subunit [Mailhella sp.]